MSLVEALSSLPPQLQAKPCRFARLMDGLDDKERSALDAAIKRVLDDDGAGNNRVYSLRWLASVLRSEGYVVSEATISRHIQGRCCCVTR